MILMWAARNRDAMHNITAYQRPRDKEAWQARMIVLKDRLVFHVANVPQYAHYLVNVFEGIYEHYRCSGFPE